MRRYPATVAGAVEPVEPRCRVVGDGEQWRSGHARPRGRRAPSVVPSPLRLLCEGRPCRRICRCPARSGRSRPTADSASGWHLTALVLCDAAAYASATPFFAVIDLSPSSVVVVAGVRRPALAGSHARPWTDRGPSRADSVPWCREGRLSLASRLSRSAVPLGSSPSPPPLARSWTSFATSRSSSMLRPSGRAAAERSRGFVRNSTAPSVDRSTGGPLLSQSLTWILAAIVASRLTGMRRKSAVASAAPSSGTNMMPRSVGPLSSSPARTVGHASANWADSDVLAARSD